MRKNKTTVFLLSIVVLAICRLFWLSADPPDFISSSVIGDEGYWVHNARLSELFEKAFTDDFVEDVTVAPLLSFFLRISFLLFGVGFWQARLVPALFGVGSIFLFWKLFSKNKLTNYMGISVLAGNFLFFSINRLVMGESMAIFWLLLSFLLLANKKYWLVGICWGLSVLSKSNAILVFPGILGLLVLMDKVKIRDLFKMLVPSFSIILIGCGLVELLIGKSILITYRNLSGTDYLPNNLWGIFNNIKRFIKNEIWWRQGTWIWLSMAIWQLIFGKKTLKWIIGSGLMLGQIMFIAPFSNQGSDHRFLFLLLGGIILFSLGKSKIYKLAGIVFIFWQILLIYNYFSHKTFTLRDESRKLTALFEENSAITGFFSHEMVLENDLYPIYWTPGHGKFKIINKNIDKYEPEWLLETIVVDGRDGKMFTSQAHLNLGRVQEILDKIYVLPTTENQYQVELNLRRIKW